MAKILIAHPACNFCCRDTWLCTWSDMSWRSNEVNTFEVEEIEERIWSAHTFAALRPQPQTIWLALTLYGRDYSSIFSPCCGAAYRRLVTGTHKTSRYFQSAHAEAGESRNIRGQNPVYVRNKQSAAVAATLGAYLGALRHAVLF